MKPQGNEILLEWYVVLKEAGISAKQGVNLFNILESMKSVIPNEDIKTWKDGFDLLNEREFIFFNKENGLHFLTEKGKKAVYS